MRVLTQTFPLKTRVALAACSLVLASCGGGGGGTDPAALAAIVAALGSSTAGAPPAANPAAPPVANPPAPPIQAKCAMDTTVTPSYEEQRLPNKLAKTDAQSFSQRLLLASGFDKFGPDFAAKLCSNSLAGASSYDDAVTLLHTEGQKLWQAALDRVQGRAMQSTYTTLAQSDDRPLYWARLTMTLALRQWMPDFPLTDDQRAALQVEFEKASRGQLAIDFPEGPKYKRILMSGFDPFILGPAATDGNPGLPTGNPSGATIMALDGTTQLLADGTTVVIHTFILPVDYPPFIAGMQEDVLGPWFKPGAKRVDASVTMSQGGSLTDYDLEHYNGRYHLDAGTTGNDNLYPPCSGGVGGDGFPASLDCDIHPPQRWLGYASKPWKKDAPSQFTISTLPFPTLVNSHSASDPFSVVLNDAYTPGPCTQTASTMSAAYDGAQAALTTAWNAYIASFRTPGADRAAAQKAYSDASTAAKAAPQPNPFEMNCALAGGGGNYLSNASAYRNTLMRDVFGLSIPAGHIHTPYMYPPNGFTGSTFESKRNQMVAQGTKLMLALANSLPTPPSP